MHSFLRRVAHEYVPSIDNDDNDDDNDAAKKGVSYRGAAAEHRRHVASYQSLSAENKAIVDANLKSIQENCERRIVRPSNEADYKRLRELEMSRADMNGPASTSILQSDVATKKKKTNAASRDGVYEIDEYTDMLSIVKKGGFGTAGEGADSDATGSFHEHDVMETRCYQMRHDADRNIRDFVANPTFAWKLLERNNDSMCALMQMSEFDACETAIDKFRAAYTEKRTLTWRFGEFVSHFADECGMRMFCAYVTKDTENTLFAAFEMDGVRRYFVVVVFRIEGANGASAEPVMSLARTWSENAIAAYDAAMQSTESAPFTYRPCEKLEESSDYWALYNIAMCKTIQNQSVTFQYAYYSACQCVALKEEVKK